MTRNPPATKRRVEVRLQQRPECHGTRAAMDEGLGDLEANAAGGDIFVITAPFLPETDGNISLENPKR